MSKQKVYLETTMFNFYFAEDSKEKKDATIKLLNEIELGKYIPYTSNDVLEELYRIKK